MRIGDQTTQRGFTYLGVLMAVALLGLGLALTATVWSKQAERQQAAEAEWVLKQYEQALRSYYFAATGSTRSMPERLEDLTLDSRYPQPMRHLRKAYLVPCGRQRLQIQYERAATGGRLSASCPGIYEHVLLVRLNAN
jgi:type II secretory pathway pseudopilin PulG